MSAPDFSSLLAGLLWLRNNADILSRSCAHRGELAMVELHQARTELLVTGRFAVAATLAFLFAGFAFTLLVAAIFWDTPHRVGTLAWLVGAEVTVGGLAGWWARRRWHAWRPLEATQEQLHHDAQCIRQILQKETG